MTSSLFNVYKRKPIAFTHGDGVWLYDSDKHAYLDFYSGIAVNSLGHNHPAIIEAITQQARKILHVSNLFSIPEQENLATRLVENSFADKAFISNSGAEALECLIKMIRYYFHSMGLPHKKKIICFSGAFHGRTIATISATQNPKLCDGFSPLVSDFKTAHYNNPQSIKDVYDQDCAAILLEPIQGEGGIVPATHEFLHFLRDFCNETQTLLAFDEVQCGMGRSGKLFYYEHSGVTPDIMALAKGLGGGFPIGATLAKTFIADTMTPGTHGSTFGGNPLACQTANAVFDIVSNPQFLMTIEKNSSYLHKKLHQFINTHTGLFSGFRGKGFMVGLQCIAHNIDIQEAFLAERLITVIASDNVIRLLPPLITTQDNIDCAIEKMHRACEKIHPF